MGVGAEGLVGICSVWMEEKMFLSTKLYRREEGI